jgi:hypothetical protein
MPKKTFAWKNFLEWRNDIEEMIPKGICKELTKKIRGRRENFKYSDDLDFFIKLYSELGDYSILENAFVANFPLRFPFVRMYHCCRPTDTNSYYSKGICVLDSNMANEEFRNLFLNNPLFPEVTKSHIEQAISNRAGSHMRHDYVYFGIDDRFLIKHCSHYLVYGSEYMKGLAAFLNRKLGCNAKSELKKIGKPTVFEVDMPVENINSEEMIELSQFVFSAWSFAIARDRTETGKLDFAIEIDNGFPPELIVGHYHPHLKRAA